MRHLVLIRVKNSEFDYAKYGLKNNYFSIDVSNAFNYSKNVGVTQYALLDGTVRADNVSREPANFTLQGLLGDVRGGGSGENFVFSTAEKNRLQNQMDLLEALRDQAIFLDLITDERTYRNCIIIGTSFGKNKFGQVDAQLNIREIIVFGDEINTTATSSTNDMTDYEQGLILDRFEMRAINTDQELVDETFRLITASELSTPFVISLGSVDVNPDVVLPTYRFSKFATSRTIPSTAGSSVTVTDTNKLHTTINAAEIMTGTVAGGNYLHLTFPRLVRNTHLYRVRYTRNSSGQLESAILPARYLHIRILKGEETLYSVQKGEILMTPTYDQIVNGIHYLNVSGSSANIISKDKYGMCFVRKLRNNKYQILPNILGNDSRGFLYVATFEIATGNGFVLYPALIYIQERAWNRIKEELRRVWSESAYFKDKELVI